MNIGAVVDPSFTFGVAGTDRSATDSPERTSRPARPPPRFVLATCHRQPLAAERKISVSTNAANGFAVYVRTSGATPNALRDGGGHSIADVSGTRASPGAAPVAGTAGFGYTSSDASTAFTSNTWAKLTNTNDSVIIGSSGTQSKSACVGYETAVSTTTSAGTYSIAVIYTAVPSF